jgi:predicted ABC-type ATPase
MPEKAVAGNWKRSNRPDLRAGESRGGPVLRVKEAGFRLHMFYLWIPSPEPALLRIRYRAQAGGTVRVDI